MSRYMGKGGVGHRILESDLVEIEKGFKQVAEGFYEGAKVPFLTQAMVARADGTGVSRPVRAAMMAGIATPTAAVGLGTYGVGRRHGRKRSEKQAASKSEVEKGISDVVRGAKEFGGGVKAGHQLARSNIKAARTRNMVVNRGFVGELKQSYRMNQAGLGKMHAASVKQNRVRMKRANSQARSQTFADVKEIRANRKVGKALVKATGLRETMRAARSGSMGHGVPNRGILVPKRPNDPLATARHSAPLSPAFSRKDPFAKGLQLYTRAAKPATTLAKMPTPAGPLKKAPTLARKSPVTPMSKAYDPVSKLNSKQLSTADRIVARNKEFRGGGHFSRATRARNVINSDWKRRTSDGASKLIADAENGMDQAQQHHEYTSVRAARSRARHLTGQKTSPMRNRYVTRRESKGWQLSKAFTRNYDPEARRQLRTGAAVGAGVLGGGALMFRGGRGIRSTTRFLRDTTSIGLKDVEFGPNATDTERKLVATARRSKGVHLASGGIHGSKKDLAQLGGGTALVGGATALDQHSRSRRGGRWN